MALAPSQSLSCSHFPVWNIQISSFISPLCYGLFRNILLVCLMDFPLTFLLFNSSLIPLLLKNIIYLDFNLSFEISVGFFLIEQYMIQVHLKILSIVEVLVDVLYIYHFCFSCCSIYIHTYNIYI